MIDELCIEASALAELRQRLLASEVEQCAVLFASTAKRAGGQLRQLVREAIYPDRDSYRIQSDRAAELAPSFVAAVAKRAKLEGLGLVFVHTHPDGQAPDFSLIDDAGEAALRAFLKVRGVLGPHAALVLSHQGLRCRSLGEDRALRVLSLGAERIVESEPQPKPSNDRQSGAEGSADLFDRQVRAFGADGQRRLEALRVAVVGVGGTGSIAVQQLVHLGVRDFILVDPDLVEDTNLNRIVGATLDDIGREKIAVARRYLKAFRPGIHVRCVAGNIVHDHVARELVEADLIFCCTDSHGSRAVVQQVAYQYMIPCIDMGSTIAHSAGRVTGIFGRVQYLAPGHPCLWCSHLLDAAQVRRDMASEVERRLDPYMEGSGEPAPSVISLNGTVVSLAISMMLSIVCGAPIMGRHLIYNASNTNLRLVRGKAEENCFICSKVGALGWGDARPLFTRRD